MKSFSVVLSVALASFAVAQDGLPDCAKSCADKFLSGGIGNCGTDPKCICANKDFISGISCCLIDACDTKDQDAAIGVAQGLCSANGVSVPSTVACATATGTAANSGATNTANPTAGGSQATETTPSGTGNFAPRQTAAAGIIGGIVAAVALL